MRKLAIISMVVFFMAGFISIAFFQVSATSKTGFHQKFNFTAQNIEINTIDAHIKVQKKEVDKIHLEYAGFVERPVGFTRVPELKVKHLNNLTRIKTRNSLNYFVFNKFETLNITLPKDFNGKLSLKTTRGNIDIDSWLEHSDIKAIGTDIKTPDATYIKIKTVSGDINAGKVSRGHFETISGDVSIKATGINYTTVSGHFTGKMVPGNAVLIKTTSGNLHIKD